MKILFFLFLFAISYNANSYTLACYTNELSAVAACGPSSYNYTCQNVGYCNNNNTGTKCSIDGDTLCKWSSDDSCPDGLLPDPVTSECLPILCPDGVTTVEDLALCPVLCSDGITWVDSLDSCPILCPDGFTWVDNLDSCPQDCPSAGVKRKFPICFEDNGNTTPNTITIKNSSSQPIITDKDGCRFAQPINPDIHTPFFKTENDKNYGCFFEYYVSMGERSLGSPPPEIHTTPTTRPTLPPRTKITNKYYPPTIIINNGDGTTTKKTTGRIITNSTGGGTTSSSGQTSSGPTETNKETITEETTNDTDGSKTTTTTFTNTKTSDGDKTITLSGNGSKVTTRPNSTTTSTFSETVTTDSEGMTTFSHSTNSGSTTTTGGTFTEENNPDGSTTLTTTGGTDSPSTGTSLTSVNPSTGETEGVSSEGCDSSVEDCSSTVSGDYNGGIDIGDKKGFSNEITEAQDKIITKKAELTTLFNTVKAQFDSLISFNPTPNLVLPVYQFSILQHTFTIDISLLVPILNMIGQIIIFISFFVAFRYILKS